MSYVRTYSLPFAWVHEHSEYVHTVFLEDRSESVFAPPPSNARSYPDFAAAAHLMGYADMMRYAVEHELAHQVTALHRGLPHSHVVWLAAHNETIDPDSQEVKDEEHLANQLQRFCNTGIEDDFGRLRLNFGNKLENIAHQFLLLARPWLAQV